MTGTDAAMWSSTTRVLVAALTSEPSTGVDFGRADPGLLDGHRAFLSVMGSVASAIAPSAGRTVSVVRGARRGGGDGAVVVVRRGGAGGVEAAAGDESLVDALGVRRDLAPGVPRLGAAATGGAVRGTTLRVVEERPEGGRQGRLVARFDVQAGRVLDDGVDEAADAGRHDGTPHAIASSGDDPERLVPGGADDDVRAAVHLSHLLLRELPAEGHVVADAELPGQGVQPLVLGVVGQVRARGARAADDDEFDVAAGLHELRHGGDGRADALALHESGGGEDPEGAAALLDGAVRSEQLDVDTARDDGDGPERHAEALQFERLVGAGGDDLVGTAADGGFEPLALGRARVGGPLVATLHDAEGVEGLHDGMRGRRCAPAPGRRRRWSRARTSRSGRAPRRAGR